MPGEPTEKAPTRPPGGRRKLRIVLYSLAIAVLLFELVYVCAVRYIVNSGKAEAWMNVKPDKVRISFTDIRSWIPGRVVVTGLKVTGQSRKIQYEVTADRVKASVSLFALAGKRVVGHGATASGVTYRQRNRPKTAEEASPGPGALPPIEGFAWEPFTGTIPPRKPRPWVYEFSGTRVEGIREVWIGAYRLQVEPDAPGTAEADVLVGPDRMFGLPSAKVHLGHVAYSLEGKPAGTIDSLDATAKIDQYDTLQNKGKAMLPFLSVSATIESESEQGSEALNGFVKNVNWLRFERGRSKTRVSAAIDHGRLLPGSTLDIAPGNLTVYFSGFAAGGDLSVHFETVDSSEGTKALAHVQIERYELRQEGSPPGSPALAKGDALQIIAARGLRLPTPEEVVSEVGIGVDEAPSGEAGAAGAAQGAAAAESAGGGTIPGAGTAKAGPLTKLELWFDLGQAEVPDLTVLNDILPEATPLSFRTGSAQLTGTFRTEESSDQGRGFLHLVTPRLQLGAKGMQLAGGADVYVNLPQIDFTRRELGIAGSRFTLTGFGMSRAEGAIAERDKDWRADFDLTGGTLGMSKGFDLDARIKFALSDSRPLVAFLSEKKPLPGWEEKLLTIEQITGSGRIRLSGRSIFLAPFHAEGEKFAVEADLVIRGKNLDGRMLAEYGRLGAGIELTGDDRKLHLVRPRSWYEKSGGAAHKRN